MQFGAPVQRHVSAGYVAMVAVGMVVGAGIFKSPSVVAANAGSFEWLMAAWLLGGLISLIGALCYAELATAFANPGGDFYFLRCAFGRSVALLFAWTRFVVINTGSIAMLGFIIGDYVNAVLPLGPAGPAIYATVSILMLTAFNLRASHARDAANYALTALEVLGVLLLAAAGLWLALKGVPPATSDLPAGAPTPAHFGLAMVFVLLAFGGWTEVATLSAEAKDPRHGMARAMIVAVVVITALYLLVNWALWRGLGLQGLATSRAPAADLMARAFGASAETIVVIAVVLAAATSINATIQVGARTTFAASQEWPLFAPLARWSQARGGPAAAIAAQSGVALILVGLGALTRDGFATLVDYTAPGFWLFLMLSGLSVLVLRRTRPEVERPFRTPLVPLTPLLFAGAGAFMLWSSLAYAVSLWADPANSRVGAVLGALVVLGGLVLVVMTPRPAKASGAP
jgi:amino acid transporter